MTSRTRRSAQPDAQSTTGAGATSEPHALATNDGLSAASPAAPAPRAKRPRRTKTDTAPALFENLPNEPAEAPLPEPASAEAGSVEADTPIEEVDTAFGTSKAATLGASSSRPEVLSAHDESMQATATRPSRRSSHRPIANGSIQTELALGDRETGMNTTAGHCRLVAIAGALSWIVRDTHLSDGDLVRETQKRLRQLAERHPEAIGLGAVTYVCNVVNPYLADDWNAPLNPVVVLNGLTDQNSVIEA